MRVIRILLHSNGPFNNTAYGLQATSLAECLTGAGHEVVFSAPFSFGGSPIVHKGFTCLPGGADPFGSDTIAGHYASFGADLLLTLCDVFMMDPAPLRALNVAHWTPVDCDRLGTVDAAKLLESGGAPIAMSRHGERLLRAARFSPYYAPHSVDTSAFRPLADRDEVRARMGLEPGTFAVGINAANKAGPRKAYPEQMAAFARFHKRHPQARLLVHALVEPKDGVNLKALADNLGITGVCLYPDQYAYVTGQIPSENIATWCGALDVLLNATFGEGFGVPVVEAQATGTPVIVPDFSTGPELLGAGWKVAGQDHWVPGHNAWWRVPFITSIEAALEKAWLARETGRMPALQEKARRFALRYDTQAVFTRYWQPILGHLEERRIRTMTPPLVARERKMSATQRDLLVIVPSRGRPENVKRLVAACAETCTATTDLIFGFDDDDPALQANIAGAEAAGTQWESPPWEHGPRKSLTAWTNDLARKYAAGYRHVASLGDDHVPRTPGWDTSLLDAISAMGGTGFAYPNGLGRTDIPEAVVVSSDIVQTLGWFANPELSHFWIDNTWADLGKNAGCIAYLPSVIVEHINAVADPSVADTTYRESAQGIPTDQDAYQRWRTERMRGDVATLRALRASKGKPDVAIDYRERLAVWSDIQDHLPYLYKTALRYPNVRVLELGTRCGFSTSAFLAATVKVRGKVWSADLDLPRVPSHWHSSPLWEFRQSDSLELEHPGPVDVLFLDTAHTFDQALAELERFIPLVAPGGVVLVHDTALEVPGDAPGEPPYPVAKALGEFCARAGLTWKEHGGIYGLGEISIPGGA